jgi:hypothetical protein
MNPLYIAESEDVLVEFTRLSREYPGDDAVTLFEEAGGHTDGYHYFGCSWCGKQFPYDQLSKDVAAKAANEHALTCESDPRAAQLAEAKAALVKIANKGYCDNDGRGCNNEAVAREALAKLK